MFTGIEPWNASINVLFGLADAVLECFFKLALEDFVIGRVLEADLHPDYCSPRVATYVLVKKPDARFAY